jgi:hypothetical protein
MNPVIARHEAICKLTGKGIQTFFHQSNRLLRYARNDSFLTLYSHCLSFCKNLFCGFIMFFMKLINRSFQDDTGIFIAMID